MAVHAQRHRGNAALILGFPASNRVILLNFPQILKNSAFCPSFTYTGVSAEGEKLSGLVRCTNASDPHRCQGVTNSGQCWNAAEHGSKFCRAHGGVSTRSTEEKRSYLVSCAEMKARLAELSSQPDFVAELNNSLAVIHILIEKLSDKIATDSDAELRSRCTPLELLIRRAESLAKTIRGLQKDLGELLPRQRLIALGTDLARILMEELEGVDRYDEIMERIMDRIFVIVNNPPKLEPPSV